MSKDPRNTPILEHAREVLALESGAITELSSQLDQNFETAIKLIESMVPGARLVVCGIGKTGFVAQKISATFASIGVPSFFLHPAEAVHGDLGRFTKHDLVLIFSNSGETPEVLRIIPHIKRIGCSCISVTSDHNSNLAKHSDVALSIGKVKEAGPLGLAPTTSTTAMLALGDALAMVIFHRREYSAEQFAFYHPGGNLGATLMPVSEVMRQGEEHCIVPEDLKSREVLHRITATKGRPGAASIVDRAGLLVGIFTDGNLRRCLDQNDNFLDLPIREVMTRDPKKISVGKLAPEALRLMSELKIDQVIVVDQHNKPVGMIDIQDLVKIGLA